MLLDLATGDSIESITERLEVARPAAQTGDTAVLDSLKRPAAQTQFAFIDDQDELRRVIESGDLKAWRTFLHPEQRRYVGATFSGPFRLSGGAGTGKTVVLIHRARALARRDPKARILLTTFTTNLADALREDVAELDPSLAPAGRLGEPGVFAAGVDSLAATVIRQAGAAVAEAVAAVLGGPRAAVNSRTPGTRWRDVVEASLDTTTPVDRPPRRTCPPSTDWSCCRTASGRRRSTCGCAAPAVAWRWTGPAATRCGISSRRIGCRAGSTARWTTPRRPRWPPPTWRKSDRSSITCSSTRGRTYRRCTGRCCARWSRKGRTICSSLKTRISASTVPPSCSGATAFASSADPVGSPSTTARQRRTSGTRSASSTAGPTWTWRRTPRRRATARHGPDPLRILKRVR